jgi:N-acetylglucosaminyldiphosphoundecaprenol N-acetyl-beta-D-mannosaminyltransferase
MNISILGTNISTISNSEAIQIVLGWADNHESRSVYACNVHMLMEAYDSEEFKNIVNSADLVTPDGMPIVWYLRNKGHKEQERVYGPTIMWKLLSEASKDDIPVGLYGSTPTTLDRLSERAVSKFPGLDIRIKISPPFDEMTIDEEEALVEKINRLGVKILFVGLGCPKQECWIARNRGKIRAVMVGVGAAFAFHSGVIKQAPFWMQKSGLEWLFRLIQEPKRLWLRYFSTIPKFIFLILWERIRQLALGNR